MATKTETVWVVSGKSESCDEYLSIFKNRPTKSQLKKLVFEWDGDEENPDGPGDFGSFVYISVTEEEVL